MKHTLAAIGLVVATAASAQNIAVVNGKGIPSSRGAALEAQIAASGQPVTDEIKARIKDELINREIFMQEALARGLNKSDAYKEQMELARSTILIRALITDEQAKNPVTDAVVKAEYDRLTAEMNIKEYNAAHILVKEEKEAVDLIKQLKAGADFASLAKKHSQDPGSGAAGGNLDWAGADAYVPEFSQAMVALNKGEITQAPVKSQFGWHVIRLIDVRQAALPPYEQVKAAIEKNLRERQFSDLQAKLRGAARIQ
jgi:peptidyl-prolyl cis-trans isomerase C